MAPETPRPTPEEWQASVPTLKRSGSQLQGACPLCGGRDRFHVNLVEPHLFGCRQCEDGPGILRAAGFGAAGDESQKPAARRARRPNSDFQIAEYRTAAGKITQMYRKDWPIDWQGEPCDWPDCKESGPHKHIWRDRGQPTRNLLLLLWPPTEPFDADLMVIGEGEKAAAATQHAGYTGVSYCGGVPAGAQYADYTPVAGRPCLVWPDADKAGIKGAHVAVEKCFAAGASSVHLLTVEEGAGEDAADYSVEEIRRLVTEAIAGEALEPPDVGQGIQGAPSRAAQYIQPDQHGLRAILDYLRLDVRENPRNLRTEIRRTGPLGEAKAWAKQWAADTHPGGWIAMTDSIEASLRQVSREHFVFRYDDRGNKPATWTDRDLSDAILNNCPRPAADPFRSWLEGLPAWDGQERIALLWIETLAMPDTELTREAGRRFLIGAVRRSFDPGCVHDWIPVLVGAQGLGKSSMLRELVSPAREWFSDGTQLDGDSKTKMETTGPAVISEFSEMAGLDRADSARFKTYLSQQADQLRPAYGRHAQRTERRWVGVGTANDDPEGVLPADSTGQRRYAVMKSAYQGTDNELAAWATQARAWVRTKLHQLWAEALHDYQQAVKAGDDKMNLIPGHLRSTQEAAAAGFQRHFEGLREVAHQLIRYGQDYERGHGYGPTIAELMHESGVSEDVGAAAKDRSTQIYLAKELKAAGWAKRQRKVQGVVSQRWHAPLPQDQALVDPAQGQCLECDNVPTIGTLCDECREKRLDDLSPPGSGAGSTGAPPPSQRPLDTGLKLRIDAIDRDLQAMRSEGVSYAEAMQLVLKGENGLQAMGPTQPDKFALLMLKRNGLQALRDAQPDKLVIRELLDLWSGAAGFVSMIESAIEASPGVMWESFDWPPVLRGASVLVQEQVKREREGVLQQAQEWLRQRLLQPSLLPGDGSPA